MTLYEINEELLKAERIDEENAVDTTTGEIIDISYLDSLEMEKEEKIENISLWIKNLKAESEAIEKEEKALKKRRDAAANKAENLKNYLQMCLNGEKFKTAKVSISYRNSTSVWVADGIEGELPDELCRIKREPNKTLIKEKLSNGEEVLGCLLETKQSLIIK